MILRAPSKHMIFNYKTFLLSLIFILSSNNIFANIDKLKITSNNLKIQKDNSTATFTGSVTVVFDDLKLITTKLIVFYDDVYKKKDIKKIIIPNKLKAIRNCGTEIVIANKGFFDNFTRKLTLEGDVKMQQNDNILVTDKMVYSTSFVKIN